MDRDWGVPDWKNEPAYRSSAYLSEAEMRWEFLRRNPTYRQAWITHSNGLEHKNFDWQFEFGTELPWDPARPEVPSFVQKHFLYVPFGSDDDDLRSRAIEFIASAGRSGYVLARIDPSISFEQKYPFAVGHLSKIGRRVMLCS